MFENQAKTIDEIRNASNIRIHEGIFHMDDLMCVSLVKKINPNVNIIRDRDNISDDTKDIICDCYGGYFDHHNVDNIKHRENGTPMASMGCLVQVIGEEVFGPNWKQIDVDYIAAFDAADLGIKENFISSNIGKLNPGYKRNEESSIQIQKAIEMCDTIVDSLINPEKTLKNTNEYLNNYFQERQQLKDSETNLSNYFGSYGQKIKEEIENPQSSLSYILSGLDEHQAQNLFNQFLDTEHKTFEIKNEMTADIDQITKECIEEQKDFAIFEDYPGSMSVFSDTPVKYVIFRQSGTEKYCINTIATNDSKAEGFPPAKLPFPKELAGKEIILKKEVNDIYPRTFELLRTVNPQTNYKELSDNLSNILDRKIEISSQSELKEFKNDLVDSYINKRDLLKAFDEKGLDFVHPGQFFVQAKDRESAINFVSELLSDENYLKNCEITHLERYVKESNLDYNIPKMLKDENTTLEHVQIMKKAITEGFSKEDVDLLNITKYSRHEITSEILECIKTGINEETIKDFIKENLSSESIKTLRTEIEKNPENTSMIQNQIQLLKLNDKYKDLDFRMKEITDSYKKEISLVVKENPEITKTETYKILSTKIKENKNDLDISV